MGKSSELVLLLSVLLSAAGYAAAVEKTGEKSASAVYTLDEGKAAEAEQKAEISAAGTGEKSIEAAAEKTVREDSAAAKEDKESDKARIVREEKEDGYVEKLLSPEGKLIAKKTVKDDEIVQKVLYYYHPDGSLARRVTADTDGTGFYAEDYYPNGKLAGQATYLNESSKIGKEKKYDNNGILRQEIEWVHATDDGKGGQPLAQKTVRRGNVITYYPDGRLAASLPVDKEGKAVFYNRQGKVIKEVKNAGILNFAPELNKEDCPGKVTLTLEDMVELYEDEGDISYNKCGLPYRESFIYEVTEVRGNLATKISYDGSGMIRKITPYVGGLRNGIEQKFDASGNLTAEINYLQGQKDGTATGYFPSKKTAFRKVYQDGKVAGTLTCYFPTGEVAAEFNYKDGKKDGTAIIYGPQERRLEFAGGEIVGAASSKKSGRRLVSKLSALAKPDEKCLNIDEKINQLNLDIEANTNTVAEAFKIRMPLACRDFSAFKPENSNYACYDALDKLRALLPTGYNRNEYAVETVYSAKGKLQYEIPYYQKLRQGFARQYDDKGNIIAEMYFDRGELADSSRSYYTNGAVKEMLTVAEDKDRQLRVRYLEDGSLAFNINYNDGQKTEAFIAEPEKNKDVYLRYYDGALDYIREVNAGNPLNFIEYNLATGEYTVYRGNKLIKGGKICGYEKDGLADETPESTAAAVEKNISPATENIRTPEAAKNSAVAVAAVASMLKATENNGNEIKEPVAPAAVNEPAAAEPVAPVAVKESAAAEPVAPATVKEPAAAEPVAPVAVKEPATAEPVAPAAVKEPAAVEPVAPVAVKEPAAVEPVAPVAVKEPAAAEPVAPAAVKEPVAAEPVAPVAVKEPAAAEPVAPAAVEIPPVISAEDAPFVDGLEPIDPLTFDDIKVKNAIIPTAEEKKQEELAAKNIGPVAKPNIGQLADVVDKEHLDSAPKTEAGSLEKTEKFYYPNGKLRKTVRTKGSRTKEIKEYSKTGLLLTDTAYRDEDILIEKYFGSGEIRRKTLKGYTDNAVMAFLSREDFFDNGKTRYEIKRRPDALLFDDKDFTPEGNLQKETTQTSPLSFVTKEYAADGKTARQIEQAGWNVLEQEFSSDGKVKSLKLNGAAMPVNLAKNTADLLKDNMKTYAKNGAVAAEFKSDGKKDALLEYHPNGKLKSEIIFYHNGEISVQIFDKEGNAEKAAYLAPDGKLHIQKPSARTVPAYRERHWVDYNNPDWIENRDKYSVKFIGRLNLDTASYILAELDAAVPDILKKLYGLYEPEA